MAGGLLMLIRLEEPKISKAKVNRFLAIGNEKSRNLVDSFLDQ